MTWQLTHDVDEFHHHAGPHLAADPVRNTGLLTVSETVRRHGPGAYGDSGGPPPRFGWWMDGDGVTGAFLQTPPHPPLLGPLTPHQARELARALRADGAVVTGVKGPDDSGRAFADEWAGPGQWSVDVRLRLFRLGELCPPQQPPPGRARKATTADVAQAAAWMTGFAADTGSGTDTDQTSNVSRRIAYGGLYLWEVEGRPVSMAAHSPVLVGHARIAPVYTPPGSRGRGFAGAVTAAASLGALEAGARQVLLFADADDPIANRLYERLGYRPLAPYVELDFGR
ncbi:GNAT family N-acetyltransferase [Streptomyces sp. PKU-EA00015]|uniref:GNAT family N-acetyltransferase n=1 Tax=Streptomyces sp. PKU-EA00015 TaxID=2748326 RepID=UPI0015A3EA8F|nr:GNAT family N-acetyltransferase [Streptomyces sp. PKU-EA00015]NWF27593.1 GNAT family N-acetyltransferase [Streptomyces sp. PKU-EA00015]